MQDIQGIIALLLPLGLLALVSILLWAIPVRLWIEALSAEPGDLEHHLRRRMDLYQREMP